MNRYIETANFDIDKFPLDCGTLRGMQDNTAILAVLARIAAGNGTGRLILCGCEDMRNGYRGEGYIWKASEERPLTGEIIYHPEQSLQNKFLIEEMSESVNVDNTDYLNLYRHKVANDTSIGGEVWSDYTRLDEVSNVALKALIAAEADERLEADKRIETECAALKAAIESKSDKVKIVTRKFEASDFLALNGNVFKGKTILNCFLHLQGGSSLYCNYAVQERDTLSLYFTGRIFDGIPTMPMVLTGNQTTGDVLNGGTGSAIFKEMIFTYIE
ncbi:MAG: hypothetical protein MJZ66_05780 [Bacteroidales bacterium]|nr:hypothetical protein [Bacteroidales bacterium]